MSIEKNWRQVNEQRDDDLSSLLQNPGLLKRHSKSPLKKIKTNLLINMIWGIVICLFYFGIIIHFQIWPVQLGLVIVIIFSIWGLSSGYRLYKNIDTGVSSAPLLAEMKRHHQTITRWITTQERMWLYIYPICAAAGFMLGGVIGSRKPVEVFMGKPFVLVIMLIIIAILVPACYYLAKWMLKYSFGKHLDSLQQHIDELEQEK